MFNVAARWLLVAAAAAAAAAVAAAAETTFETEGMGNRSFYLHINERERGSLSSVKADCMFDSRSYMTPYPYDCYSHSFVDAWNEFQNFFNEIGGDFRFTFDFVLYDKNFPFAKENQLWYLMAFLKELRTLVPDPDHILAKGGADEHLESFSAALEARVAPVRKEYAALMERLQDATKLAEAYHQKSLHPSKRRTSPRASPHSSPRAADAVRAASAYNIITTRQFDNEKRAYHGKNTVLIKP